jgi:hypothetical protein
MMPKGSYRIMTAYMPKVGKHGLDMMYRTCTVQTNLDYSSEANMVKKLRLSLALQPVATAMFANSPFTEGKPNGFLSFRSEIWRDTDADRCGRRSSLLWASSATSTKPSDLMRACRWIERVMKLSLDIDPPEPLGAVAPQGRPPRGHRPPGLRIRSCRRWWETPCCRLTRAGLSWLSATNWLRVRVRRNS